MKFNFNEVGSFLTNGEDVVFLSFAEKIALEEFIKLSSFEVCTPIFDSTYISSGADFNELIDVLEAISLFDVKVNPGVFSSFRKIFPDSCCEDSSFLKAEVLAKAILLFEPAKNVIQTERRLDLVDCRFFKPTEGQIAINKYELKGFKTVCPDSFDAWVSLLLKAKTFKTKDPQLQRLKSLFSID